MFGHPRVVLDERGGERDDPDAYAGPRPDEPRLEPLVPDLLHRCADGRTDRLRDEAGAAAESISAWSRAGREVARVRKEQFALRRERDAKIRELGVSVYEEDGRADELKAEAKELDARLEQSDRELQRAIAAARRKTRKGRAAVVSTEILKPEEPEESPASAPPS